MYKYLVFCFVFILITDCKQQKDKRDRDFINKDSINLTRDLILYYPFEDGSAIDMSGFNNHGVVRNTNKIVKGIKGNGLHITGSGISSDEGGHVELPILKFNEFGDFSINIWVKEEGWTNQSGNAYFSWGDETSGILGIFSHRGRPSNDSARHTKFAVGSTWSYHDDVNDPTNVLMLDRNFDESEKLGKWVFYTLNYKKGIINAYRNAQFIGALAQKVKVGIEKGGINRHWWHNGIQTCSRMTGIVDEFRVYKRALNEVEIKALYQLK